MLKGRLVNNDNLHRIAISNLNNDEKKLIRWWCDRYKQPPKQLDDYTFEELYVEQLEHYYSKNPDKISDFFAKNSQEEEAEWDGRFDGETERRISSFWSKRKSGTIKKYQTDNREYSDEEIEKMLGSVGKHLPGSKTTVEKPIDEEEFDDLFD
jgi:hypothetical protein